MTYQPYAPMQPKRENKFMRIFNIISGWSIFAFSFPVFVLALIGMLDM